MNTAQNNKALMLMMKKYTHKFIKIHHSEINTTWVIPNEDTIPI